MGRSVETPSNARSVCYRDVVDYDEDGYDWEMLKEYIIETVVKHWPSFENVDYLDVYLSNETRVICSSTFAQVTISEYCGCCCVALVPLDDWDGYAPDLSGMARRWCNQIAAKFQELFNEMVRTGVMSNGIAVYEKVKP